MANRWEYDEASHRYRDTKTGRFLSPASAVDLRDDFQARRRVDLVNLTGRLADEEITVQQWETEMQSLVRQVHGVEYAFGRGGRNAMTDAELAELADLVKTQHGFLRQFAQDVASGKLSEAQIAARANLYYASSVQAYERGRAAGFGVQPPHVPGDGSTPCGANCRCFLTYVETADEVHITWHKTANESCSGCKNRAASWKPLVIAKSTDGRIARLYRRVA
jgi:hypothetical protein